MTDYDSRRTGNGLLDTGSTPVWSTEIKTVKNRSKSAFDDFKCGIFFCTEFSFGGKIEKICCGKR